MIAMDDIKVEFNGIDLTSYGIWSVNVDGQKPHIFAGSKNITTSRPIYSTKNVLTGLNYEPLSFSLTLAPYENSWTEQYVIEIYKLFDVNTYKPLRFGDDEMYYNVMPYVGSVSEMMLFAQSKGYVTIPFLCDAGHGWIDKQYKFEHLRAGRESVIPIYNPCNVLGKYNDYRVYPYIVIEDFDYTDIQNQQDNPSIVRTFVSFGLSEEIKAVQDESKKPWFNICYAPASSAIYIDGANQQIYDPINNVNMLECIKANDFETTKIWFPYIQGGNNIIWNRFLNQPDITSTYTITFYLTCPFMK